MTVLPTFDMLLFGGTGDLVTRKLLPALFRRFAAGQVSAESRVFGVARSPLSRRAYTAQAEAACREFLGQEFDAKQWQGFSRMLDYLKIDAGAAQDYAALPAIFKDRDTLIRVFFFSTASNLFSVICQNLAKAKVVTPLSRVVLEKPLGHDSASANLINEQVGAVFAEKQIFDTWRWAGVPFYLRTGKRLQDRLTELVVTFDEVPHPIFEMPSTTHTANELVIRLQPDESIIMTILAKNPGEGMRLKPVSLALDLGETFKTRSLDAYERLLMDTVKGNLTLFMRRDELDAAWAWIDPIRAGWEQHDEGPKIYIAGTWGPASSSAMLSRDRVAWHGEL